MLLTAQNRHAHHQPVDHALIKRRVKKARAYRMAHVRDTDAIRVIFGEADGFPEGEYLKGLMLRKP